MKIEDAVDDVDQVVEKARVAALAIISESERRFVESTTSRGALSVEEALQVCSEQREGALAELDDAMARLRAWVLRGGVDTH